MATGSLEIRWEVEGQVQMARRLENIRIETNDFSPAFKKSTQDLKRYYEGPAFESQGGLLGEAWPPLSPFTIQDKQNKGFGAQPPMMRTGNLKKSFNNAYSKVHGEIWNDATYFKYHQSKRPRTKLPRRVMLKLNEYARQTVIQNTRKHLRRAVRGGL